jgi:CDP-diacylglycerol pyrophosphatase
MVILDVTVCVSIRQRTAAKQNNSTSLYNKWLPTLIIINNNCFQTREVKRNNIARPVRYKDFQEVLLEESGRVTTEQDQF